jgi:hypothetical protein
LEESGVMTVAEIRRYPSQSLDFRSIVEERFWREVDSIAFNGFATQHLKVDPPSIEYQPVTSANSLEMARAKRAESRGLNPDPALLIGEKEVCSPEHPIHVRVVEDSYWRLLLEVIRSSLPWPGDKDGCHVIERRPFQGAPIVCHVILEMVECGEGSRVTLRYANAAEAERLLAAG